MATSISSGFVIRSTLVLAALLSGCSTSNFTADSKKTSSSEDSASGNGKGKDLDESSGDKAEKTGEGEEKNSTDEAGVTVAPDGSGSDGFFSTEVDGDGAGAGGNGSGGNGDSGKGGDGGNGSGGNGNGGEDGGDGGSSTPNKLIKVPRFAMLVNDLKCAMCHLKVRGDVASTEAVNDWSDNHAPIADEIATGNWFAAKTWTDKTPKKKAYPIKVELGVKENHRGPELPNTPGTKTPAFPIIDFATADKRMSGTLTGFNPADKSAVTVTKVHKGNLVISGTAANPMTITGSILITGDLVIKGVYSGLGTLYVKGRVYIPADLTASDSVFPYPEAPAAALAKGVKLVKEKKGDALGIATAKSVFVADLGTTLYDNDMLPANQKRAALGVETVYSWYDGGKGGYEKLYEPSINCATGKAEALKSFNRIDAFLYAVNSVVGISRSGSWAINGGIITDNMHLLGTVTAGNNRKACPATASPAHGLPMDRNYVSYDYRMQAGMRILGEIAPYFQ